MFSLSKSSREKMDGVDPILVSIVELAITRTKIDFKVIEGLRTLERQRELLKAGRSQTLKSKHIVGKAVDLCALIDGKVSWDFHGYLEIAEAMNGAATELGVTNLVWGGNWKSLRDGPHFQLGK